MKRFSKLLLIVIVTALAGACSQAPKKSDSQSNTSKEGPTLIYERTVAFISMNGDTLSSIKAAIADSDKERNQGLMDVRKLPSNKGMLFVFKENKQRGFWMANTPLPLDIFFVNEDKRIVRIHHNAQPFSEESLTSDKPAKYVIETNSGYAISHDIQEGMNVVF